MKFQLLLTITALSASSVLTLALPDAEIIAARHASSAAHIEKRACDTNTPCKGYGWAPGLYCGDGNYGCIQGHVYQIGGDTSVCDYGVRDSCVQCNQLSC
ncbi:hypothetical protein BDN72DRAFT_828426 [Pluteus cervinus]|uniref:Uncharacterized protein n=1 Tax=Pluteus cervinus TaxID=181527 RepID=A0ACD3A7A1_9AGAR|nr:hypothetical protein BDN72DRAFT_828426 [Pluteus cervinus]